MIEGEPLRIEQELIGQIDRKDLIAETEKALSGLRQTVTALNQMLNIRFVQVLRSTDEQGIRLTGLDMPDDIKTLDAMKTFIYSSIGILQEMLEQSQKPIKAGLQVENSSHIIEEKK